MYNFVDIARRLYRKLRDTIFIIREKIFELMFWINSSKYGINTSEKRERNIIISLTSYPKRFSKLHLVIESVMKQSVKADKIILYLGEDSKNIEIPSKLKKLETKGLEIVRKSGDLKSHKKYFYVMQEYPEDIVITIDDDLIYEKHMIKLLMQSYKKYPNAISAKRVHRMKKEDNGKLISYNQWESQCSYIYEPAMDLFATSGAGTLFPPKCLDVKVFESDIFMNECMKADDIWLKFMQVLKGTPTVFVKGKRMLPISVVGTQEEALSKKNVNENMNDIYIKNLEKILNISLADYCK